MEKIFEKEIEKILKEGEKKKYLTTTYKKLPGIISITLHGAIMRINTIVKGDDLYKILQENRYPFRVVDELQ